MQTGLRDSGIERIGPVPWGTHLCQFYRDKEDLLEILIPFFRAGLEANEYCMWVISAPLAAAEAAAALRGVVPDLEERRRRGQIEIVPHDQWYLPEGLFDPRRVLKGWESRLNRARARGYEGVRITGSTPRGERAAYLDSAGYEAAVNSMIGRLRIIALCTYAIDRCGASEAIEVVDTHRFALVRCGSRWETIECSEQRKGIAALGEDERRLRLLFDHMGTGCAYHQMIYCDGRPVDYVFLEVNPAFERLTGLPRASIIGRRVTDVLPEIHNDEFDWIGTYGRVATSGEPAHFERRALGRWYSVSAFSPTPGYFVALFDDVTDRRDAEEHREDLIRAVTHDLRAPLSVISLAAEMMARRPGVPPPHEVVDAISRSCRQMQSMLQDLADAARLDGGVLRLERRPIDLAQFMLEMVRGLEGTLDVSRVRLRMERDVPAIDADPDRLERILTNLLTNAIKYSPADRPVSITVRPVGGFARISIEDEGVGIAPEDLPHIFERFYRAKTAQRIDGLGLGLHIARALAEAHGGRITVESRPGLGSRFEVDIPSSYRT